MNMKKLSINKACMMAAVFFGIISAAMLTILYLLTDNAAAVVCGTIWVVLVLLCGVLFIALVRSKLVLFSDTFCRLLDDMLTGQIEPPQVVEEESLFYKINHRLVRLYEVMRENRDSVAKERADLQELISDISHQVKTPITNLKMVNATLLEQPMPEEKGGVFCWTAVHSLISWIFSCRP